MRALETIICAALASLCIARPAHATAGSCQVERMEVAGEFPFRLPVDDFAFPVDFDEATGAFTLMPGAWTEQFGADGLTFSTGAGPDSILTMAAAPLVGHIGRDGHVVVPGLDSSFTVGTVPPIRLDSVVTLSTGRQMIALGGAPFVAEGAPLDFATGELTLVGIAFQPTPPLLGRATISGLMINCRLDPIPSADALPSAEESPTVLSITQLRGKAKVAKSFKDEDKGDVLTLKGKLAVGRATPALDGSADVLLLIREGEQTPVFIRLAGSDLTVRGKKVFVKDKTGDVIDVIAGQKVEGADRSKTGGKVTFKTKKQGMVLAAKLQGLDLAALRGRSVEASIVVGTHQASIGVAVDAKGKVR